MLPSICISSRDFERIENLLDSLPQNLSALKTRLFAVGSPGTELEFAL